MSDGIDRIVLDAMASHQMTKTMTSEDPDVCVSWTQGSDEVSYCCVRVPKKVAEELGLKRPKHVKVVPTSCADCNDGHYRIVLAVRNKKKNE